MKRVFLAAAMLLLLTSFGFAQGQDAHLDVHDFAVSYSGGVNTFQGCKGCHVPHGGAIAGEAVQPQRNTVFGTGTSDPSTGANKLWDKLIVNAFYQTYSSDNVNIIGAPMTAPAASNDPAWHSYLCFSCHDGATAVLNIPAGLVTPSNFLMNGNAAGDIDLTNDHPVDIDWPVDLVNYETTAAVTGATTPFNTVRMPLYGASNKIECSTCHNPHLQPTAANGNRGNFLRMATVPNNTSLCRTCHLSKR